MIVANLLIDSKPFNLHGVTVEIDKTKHYVSEELGDDGKKHYMSDWEYSDIREWLNNSFYMTAFTELQRGLIVETEHTLDYLEFDESVSNPYTNIKTKTVKDKIMLLGDDGPRFPNIKETIMNAASSDYYLAMGGSKGPMPGSKDTFSYKAMFLTMGEKYCNMPGDKGKVTAPFGSTIDCFHRSNQLGSAYYDSNAIHSSLVYSSYAVIPVLWLSTS